MNYKKFILLCLILFNLILFQQFSSYSIENLYEKNNKNPSDFLNNKYEEIKNKFEIIIKLISDNNLIIKSNQSFYENFNNQKINIKYKNKTYIVNNNDYKFNITFKDKSLYNIKSIKYKDNESTYEVYSLRGKEEIILKINDIITYQKDKNNNIKILFNDELYITYFPYGKLELSQNLIEEIYKNNNIYLLEKISNLLNKNFNNTEYTKLINIYKKYNYNIKYFILHSINSYRNMISENLLLYNKDLENYAEHRLEFYINNKILPNKNNLESPYLKSFSAISQYERMKLFNINDKLHEISVFYNDPCTLIENMIEDLNKRAILLSLNCKEIGIAYSDSNKLLCIMITYEKLKKTTTHFRIYPPHNSISIKTGILYESGTIRAYPISIHTDGIYDNVNLILYDNSNNEIEYTKGRFYDFNANYIIGIKEFDHGQEYMAEFPFNNITKMIKSIKVRFKTQDDIYINNFSLIK